MARAPASCAAPILVCAFKGWNDAGESASAAVQFLCESFDAEPLADIDPEDFYDFTAVRPTVRLVEGRTRAIDWPENSFHAAHVPGADRDLVMLRGVEPSLHWKAYCEAVLEVARETRRRDDRHARRAAGRRAALAPGRHHRAWPRPTALVERLGFERTSYEGPTGIVGVLHATCADAGIDSVSLWAPVPALRRRDAEPEGGARRSCAASRASPASPSTRRALETASEDYDRQVTAAVATDPDVKAFVERLEEMADEMSEDEVPSEEELPSGDVDRARVPALPAPARPRGPAVLKTEPDPSLSYFSAAGQMIR